MPKCVVFLLLLFCTASATAQRVNRYRHNERQGKWIVYHDSTHIDNIGRYRRGTPVGRWRYYDPAGNLVKTEKHRRNIICIRQYYSNGKLYRSGKAKTVVGPAMSHYFYYGTWLQYDSSGALSKKQEYRDGEKISEISYKTAAAKTMNDSLAGVLQAMDQKLFAYSDTLLGAEKNYGKKSQQYQRALALSNLNATKILDDLDRIIAAYGYPGKTLVGPEAGTIAFSIISSAGTSVKEKYYTVIVDAADRGELDWNDVAYFVDKVKVARKEKQVYATQFSYDEKQNKVFYFPVEAPESLNERRKKAGLDPLDLPTMEFINY